MSLLLKNCRLIPALSDGYNKTYADVKVEDGKIVQVGTCGLDTLEMNATVINCKGKTLLPGLFDMHAHLNWDYYNGVVRLNDFKLLVNSCLSAKKYLELGFTTIRDMGTPKRLSVYVRDAIRRGLFAGPRIISGGMILRPTVSDTPAEPNCFLRYVSGVDEYTRATREEIGGGADFVKVYAPGEPSELMPEELEAVVRIAHRRGKKVAVHAHDASAISMCIDVGVDTIEHGSRITMEDIERLKKETSYLVPTMGILSEEVPMPGTPIELKVPMLRPLLDASAKCITAAYQAGLKLGFGTDTPIENMEKVPGIEFKMRKEYCGMDNVDMLLQATKNSAFLCGLENVTGQIKVGLAADLLLVDGNPDEDISVMYKKPEMVFQQGKLCG